MSVNIRTTTLGLEYCDWPCHLYCVMLSTLHSLHQDALISDEHFALCLRSMEGESDNKPLLLRLIKFECSSCLFFLHVQMKCVHPQSIPLEVVKVHFEACMWIGSSLCENWNWMSGGARMSVFLEGSYNYIWALMLRSLCWCVVFIRGGGGCVALWEVGDTNPVYHLPG